MKKKKIKNECEAIEDQKGNAMKGMRGRENDQNIETTFEGEIGTVLARLLITISN